MKWSVACAQALGAPLCGLKALKDNILSLCAIIALKGLESSLLRLGKWQTKF